tara:strand:+ start:3572 stop:3946 length:375 start_codon:yes stop_codon:yes gene_type:complete
MATKTLSTSLTLSVIGDVFGLLSLNNTSVTSLSYDDTSVGSGSVTTSTTAIEIVAAAISDIRYIYIKNVDPNDYVLVSNATASIQYARLNPGEWLFLPVNASTGIEVKSAANTPIVEYIWFKRA